MDFTLGSILALKTKKLKVRSINETNKSNGSCVDVAFTGVKSANGAEIHCHGEDVNDKPVIIRLIDIRQDKIGDVSGVLKINTKTIDIQAKLHGKTPNYKPDLKIWANFDQQWMDLYKVRGTMNEYTGEYCEDKDHPRLNGLACHSVTCVTDLIIFE